MRIERLGWPILGLGFIAITAAIFYVALTDPQKAMELAISRTDLHETQIDPYQNIVYAVALVAACTGILHYIEKPDIRIFWLIWAWITALLLWRELTFDESIIGANTFSYGKYLLESEVPLVWRVVCGGGSVLFALASLAYIVKSIRNNSDSFWSNCGRLIPSAGIYFVLTGVSIIVSQMMDKGRSIDEIFGGSLDTWSFRMYTEECLEIYVPFFLVCAFFAAYRTFGGVGNRFPAL